jgi:hypothetical protein
MSKYLTLLVFLVSASMMAQITVNTSGNTTFSGNTTVNGFSGMGADPNNSYRLRIEYYSLGSMHSGLYVLSTGGSGSIYNYGIQGRATSPGYINYGIYGYASGGGVNWAGYFNGNVYTTGTYQSSDARLKKNIVPLIGKDMLAKILQLRPVRFEFLSESELRQKGFPTINSKEGVHIGLLAQDVEKIFPDFVMEVAAAPEGDSNTQVDASRIVTTKAVNYQELTIALLAAVQELQAEVNELKTQLGRKSH